MPNPLERMPIPFQRADLSITSFLTERFKTVWNKDKTLLRVKLVLR